MGFLALLKLKLTHLSKTLPSKKYSSAKPAPLPKSNSPSSNSSARLNPSSKNSNQKTKTKLIPFFQTTNLKLISLLQILNNNKIKAFSLLEVTATVGILGVLTGVAVPSYNKHKEKANKALVETLLVDAYKIIATNQIDKEATTTSELNNMNAFRQVNGASWRLNNGAGQIEGTDRKWCIELDLGDKAYLGESSCIDWRKRVIHTEGGSQGRCASGGNNNGCGFEAGSAQQEAEACPVGERWNGANCVSVCPGGQSLQGGVCASECATGTRWDGSACVPITCPQGQRLQGNNCVPITCPQGQRLQGNNCVPITCPAGQRLQGNNCVPITCPQGQRLQGNNCVPITCPAGQRLQGNNCVPISNPQPPNNPNPPNGNPQETLSLHNNLLSPAPADTTL